MNTLPKNHFSLFVVAVMCLAMAACSGTSTSSAPQPPKPGTPAFDWMTAQNALKSGDIVKANDLLVKLAEKTSEFTERARPLALVTSAGMADAYMELAGKYEEGVKHTRLNPMPLRRAMGDYRDKAKAAAMQYLEVVRLFTDTNEGKDVTLQLSLPKASLDEPEMYKKITGGYAVPEAEVTALEQQVVRQKVMRSACHVAGHPKDPENALALYESGEAKIPGPTFMLSTAQDLYGVSEMFGPKQLNQPNRIIKVTYEEALKALTYVKDNKDAKDLTKKITEADKKLKV